MSSIIVSGDTSGTVTLQAPAVAGSTTLTLPSTSGTVVIGTTPSGTIVGTTDTQTLTNKTLTSPTMTSPTITGASVSSMASSVLTSGTAVASTSGTSIDFTGIPSWVKRITVMFNGNSTSGTSVRLIQIGSSAGVVSTGYVSGAGQANGAASINSITTGIAFTTSGAAITVYSGSVILSKFSGNTWVASGCGYSTDLVATFGGGLSPTLPDALDRIRITTVNGTDTFDAGSINIMYE